MGFGVWGLGFGIWDLGFGVWGLGFMTREAQFRTYLAHQQTEPTRGPTKLVRPSEGRFREPDILKFWGLGFRV